jgi:phospholipase/carboxylesterase
MTKLIGPELSPKGKITSAVIFLHGLGSNGRDLLSIGEIISPSLPGTAFIAPNAPFETSFSAGGYQWFEYWGRTPFQIADDIAHTSPLIVELVESVAARFNIPHSKIVLCGFSQGTMMALYTGLRQIEGLGGIIGFSGIMMTPETLAFEKLKVMPPVLLVHGLQDAVVPAMASQQAQMVIKSLGGEAKYIQRPYLAHSIDQEGINAATKFCQDIFKKVSP